MNGVADFIKQLGPARIGAMGAVAAILVGFFAFLITRVSEPQMSLLYNNLTFDDSSAIVRQLDARNIPYQLRNDGAAILVPNEQVMKLRMTLAESGLPTGGGVGYEIFDKSDTLGATSFVQNINRLRALEGELARTIRSLDRVSTARVHLVLPDRKLFERDQKEPTASITLSVRGRLETGHIRSIQHIVASAVEGLKPSRVSIMDDKGNLLASGAEEDAAGLIASTLQERTQTYENKLRQRIEDILTKIVGPGRARVQITAELDFNRVTKRSDQYDPDGQVVRSSQTSEESSQSSSAQKKAGVTVGNELPGAQGGNDTGNTNNEKTSKAEETINYALSRITKTEVIEAGRVKRLSVGVVVDGVYTKGADGALVYAERSADDMDQITAIVRSAMGFDQSRSDQLEVINMRFAEPPQQNIAEEAGMFELTKQDYFYLAELGVLTLLTLIVLFLVVRPLLKKVIGPDPANDNEALADGTGEGAVDALPGPDGAVNDAALAQFSDLMTELDENGEPIDATGKMLEIAEAAGKLQAQTMQKIGEIAKQNPKEAALIIREWLMDEAA